MSNSFLIGYVALWVTVLLQSFVILLLIRQVGLLHLRIAPSGARVTRDGPAIGERVQPAILSDWADPTRQVDVGQSMDRDLLLLFLSPGCAVCDSIIPALKPLVRESKRDLDWAIVCTGGRKLCDAFCKRHQLDHLVVSHSQELGQQFKIDLSPYSLLIRKDGMVAAKGLVNHIEHLESILAVREQQNYIDYRSASDEPEPSRTSAVGENHELHTDSV